MRRPRQGGYYIQSQRLPSQPSSIPLPSSRSPSHKLTLQSTCTPWRVQPDSPRHRPSHSNKTAISCAHLPPCRETVVPATTARGADSCHSASAASHARCVPWDLRWTRRAQRPAAGSQGGYASSGAGDAHRERVAACAAACRSLVGSGSP